MVKWLKVAGIALIVVGIIAIFGNPVAVYSDGEHDYSYLYATVALGLALISIGVYLYHLGSRKEGKKV
jgi:O-antigen/teichoic acid export membrane protein